MKQNGVAWHVAEIPSQASERDVADVGASNADSPGLHVVDPHQEFGQRAFSRTVFPDYSNLLSGWNA